MEKIKKLLGVSVLMLAVLLSGCGSKEVVLKEFKSPDETVSISLNESWEQDDDDSDDELAGWISAFDEKDSEGVMVMQLVKGLYSISVKELAEDSFSMSGEKKIDSPAIPELSNVEAYSCTLVEDGESYQGLIAYGESDYAYYGILYIAPKMNDKRNEYFTKVCESFKESAPEIPVVESSDTVLWFNATCAVLTKLNGWDYNLFGGVAASGATQMTMQSMLDEWWGVTDEESAIETMDWLISEGHRTGFAEEMQYLAEDGLAEIPEDEREMYLFDNYEIDAEQAQAYAQWYGIYEQYGENAIAGWDYSRAMSLLANYYLAGYYTETQALDASLSLAQTIQGMFDSWDSFMESYFIGYEYWAEESSDERRGVYESIKAASDSPYNLAWDLSLEKSW